MRPDTISSTDDLGYPQWRRAFDPIRCEAVAVFTDGVVLPLGSPTMEASALLSPSPDHDGYVRLNDAGIAAYRKAKAEQQP